ncbi:DUF58 domain-containing protein [Pseudomonas cavernicola]|uniref:DUF58 domain-containing protein n=1 Tax=Pseudomonas cavernicola TaxID=2320866 RepID=A0A418XE50_9PSED|nr:DUF58 domain-containing protein [Pseudomonas cavernicola]RJG10613.1 DUF58 domain-containing protein [Pseudomonas cavernicola]
MIALLKTRWRRWLVRRIPPAASVQLTQRRIFIIPTRIGAAFGLALGLMLLAAINYQNSLAYGLTFLLASVFIVAILHTYRNLAGLTLQAAGSATLFVGELARFRVRLVSSGRAHQAIALGWPSAELQTLDVAQEGVSECELSWPALHRGWLRPGRLRVESRFPLGILVAWSWVDLDQALLVYPCPLAGELPLAAGARADDEDDGARTLGLGADDFQGLKSYQPGDSKRRLHWKAYSRGQGLLVKDFAALAGRELWLDFAALEGDVEARLSLLCHWVLQLSERQQPFALSLPGSVLAPDSGDSHRSACLRALALFGELPLSQPSSERRGQVGRILDRRLGRP